MRKLQVRIFTMPYLTMFKLKIKASNFLLFSILKSFQQISIINKAPKGSPFSLRNKGNKDEMEKELKKELKEIVKLKQSGLSVRQEFLYNLEDTIRQDIFKKTM